MSARPFSVKPVIERLRTRIARDDDGLRHVDGRLAYAAIRKLGDFPAPAAYVLLAKEKGQRTRTGADFSGVQEPLAQVVSVSFAVVLAVRNYRRLEIDDLRDELEERVGMVRDQLLGWTPDVPGSSACQLIGGDLGDYDNQTALWTDLYSTQHIIQPEIAP